MLSVIFWFAPVLWATTAAAAPIIIHLIMRTKPRKIIFPAMRFVKKTHQANISKLRLKHLILLLLRMAAIVLIVALIARGEIPNWTTAVDRSIPTAAVFVLDNSGSMTYKPERQTLLGLGKQYAQQIIDKLPPGSKMAVVATADPAGQVALLSDSKLAAEQVANVPETYSSQGVATALARAVTVLSGADEKLRKEVYLITDLTAQSWRGAPDVPAPGNVNFFVMNVGGGKDAHIGLGEVRLESRSVPVNADAAIETSVISSRLGGEATVRAELDGQVVEEKSLSLQKDSSASVAFSVQPRREGILHGRIILKQPDPLEMDNTRYFTLRAGRPVKVLIVREQATIGRGDETLSLLTAAITAGGKWVEAESVTSDRLAPERLQNARIVLLANVSSLAESHWQVLEKFVRAGGRLWIVAGPLMGVSVATYNLPAAQALMPVSLKTLEELPEPVSWKIRESGHGMLQPFMGEGNPPLTEVRCLRRFAVQSVAPDARVIVQYADSGQTPAIVLRTVGEGEVLFWNFSPVRSFSNLGGLEGGQFPVLVQRTVRLYAGEAVAPTMRLWGQNVVLSLPRNLGAGTVTVRKPSEQREEALVPDVRTRTVTVLADRLGDWTVKFAESGQSVEDGFSVNVDPAESDLRPEDRPKVEKRFPAGRVTIVTDVAEIARKQQTISQPLDLTTPLMFGLLVLLTIECFFANRFYRQAGTVLGGPGAPAK